MKIFYSINNDSRYTDVTIQKKKDLSEFVFKKKRDDTKIGKRTYSAYPGGVNHAIEILFQNLMSELSMRDRVDYSMKKQKTNDLEGLKIEYINNYYDINLNK